MFARWIQSRNLKKTKSLKEKGNKLFQQSKTAEAWQCYKQALDRLHGLTTSTENQKKFKDELILTLHLNLAACELRLGDSEEVIAHCNKALEICSTHIKAFYRRGQAYQSQQEYKLAIADYQLALSLEPDNVLIRSHLDSCQQLLQEEVKPPEYDGNGLLDHSLLPKDVIDAENREMEVGFEYEAELPARFKNCQKNPGHVNFIPVTDFQIAHLPQEYQDHDLLDLIQQHVKLTVRLKVVGNSQLRPLFMPNTTKTPYPFSGIRFRKALRTGSGWVAQVQVYDHTSGLDCPCSSCQISLEPLKCWAKIGVKTACHVVYDLIEGEKTTCYFDYNTDDTDLESCPLVSGAIEVDSQSMFDHSRVVFVTHNVEFAAKLKTTLSLSQSLCANVKEKFKVTADSDHDEAILTKMIKLYDRLCVSVILLDIQRKKFQDIFESDINEYWHKHMAKYPLTAGNETDTLGCMILSKINGNDAFARFIQKLNERYEKQRYILGFITEILEEHRGLMSGHSTKYGQLWEIYLWCTMEVTMSEQEVNMYKNILNDDSNSYPVLRPAFCATHPLTVIVSHPHGCSKKITIGQIVERVGVRQDLLTHYRYNNDTCPGSSGARVFILGKMGSVFDHPHSGTPGGNINESAANADF